MSGLEGGRRDGPSLHCVAARHEAVGDSQILKNASKQSDVGRAEIETAGRGRHLLGDLVRGIVEVMRQTPVLDNARSHPVLYPEFC
ncbi:MAG: hypothetical protein WD825_14430 [Gemmatimonadaceae bacterium]